jgi:hypothetical protein
MIYLSDLGARVMNDQVQISGNLDSVPGGAAICPETHEVLMLAGLNQQQVLAMLGIKDTSSRSASYAWIELELVGKYANLRIMDAGGNTLWHGLADQACAQPQFDAWLQAKCPAVLEPRTRLERLRGALFGH